MTVKIRVNGRNDLDMPDEMIVEYDREEDQVTFVFPGVVRSFTVDREANDDLTKIIQELRIRHE